MNVSIIFPVRLSRWKREEYKMRYALVALLFAPALAYGMTLDDLTVGKTVNGPDAKLDELKGKIVYVEYWGTR